MNVCRKTIWALVAVTVLLPAGCATQRGRTANKPKVNTAQLLAAARQYEKEGDLKSAAHIYQHVLQYHPTNAEAKQGLTLVQAGKLRVDYDPQQLLASTDPTVQSNPQARQQLAKIQQKKREQINDRMAQLIAEAARNPKKIEVDPTPTPTMVASTGAATKPQTPSAASEPATPAKSAPEAWSASDISIAHADGTAAELAEQQIETTAFAAQPSDEPADWADSQWKGHSLVGKCRDASADVLKQVQKLESHADSDRKDGLTQLALMGPEAASAVPAINELMSDQNQLVRAHAAWALWEVDGDAETAVSALNTSLKSSSNHVVQFAAYTLATMGEDGAPTGETLQSLLSHEDIFTRLHVAEALSRIGSAEQRADATDTLVVLLADADASVRHLAAIALGEVDADNAPMAVIALTAALDDEDAAVRSAAALSLGGYGQDAEQAAGRLKEVTQTDRTDVRQAAETALACIDL